MGRRHNAAKSKEKVKAKPGGGEELPVQGTNPSSERAELQPGNTKESLGKEELQPKDQAKSGGLSPRSSGKHTVSVSVRRSLRLQDSFVHAHKQDIQRVIEEIAVSESEKEEEPPSYEKTEQPNPTMEDKNLEDKIDYLVQLLEEQRIKFSPSAGPSMSNARYKSLYFESQKKIDTLTEENHQLAMRLENAMGKLEAYETGSRAYSDMLEKLKDVILVSNIARATGNAVNVSSDAYTSKDAGHGSPRALAKRRKVV